MRQSIIKVGIDNFLDSIKFDKESYSTYYNIFIEKEKLSKESFILIVLQLAFQTNFQGYFDELYLDVIKRKAEYIKYLVYNFKIALLGEPTILQKLYKYIVCHKQSDREVYFFYQISLYDFDKLFNIYFELDNDEKKYDFIKICESIYNYQASLIFDEPLNLKVKKKSKNSNKFIFHSTYSLQ